MPHWLILGKIDGLNGIGHEAMSLAILRKNAEKKCKKRVHTSENWLPHFSLPWSLRSAVPARVIFFPRSFRCRPFSLVKVSQRFSQLIHMRLILILASGLETRNLF